MKRIFSFILAALLLASSAISCGKTNGSADESTETTKIETSVTETIAPVTEAVETEAPAEYAYDTSLITENGAAKAHIVLPEGASDYEKTAADELAYHIKLISGAEVTVTNAAQEDSLPIIIATPDSLPELEELFPEDLEWLRTLEERNGDDVKRWGDDGFAIRQKDGKIYIFGTNGVGALNGTYDFIEDNFDVIWVGENDSGIIYDEMPTLSVIKANYREKSPFFMFGIGGAIGRRNKITSYLDNYGGHHNVKRYVLQSPIYDPNITEYWDTFTDGTPKAPSNTGGTFQEIPAGESIQINFWSQLTADTVAASVIAELDSFETPPQVISVCPEDNEAPSQYPAMTQPFEYAPGEFIEPKDPAYFSTVYFTFLNRVAEKVGEKYPDVLVNSIAYSWCTEPPKCEIRDNISIWFCLSLGGDDFEDSLKNAFTGDTGDEISVAEKSGQQLKGWREKTDNLLIYDYYFCYFTPGWHERPIWYRLGEDLSLFADLGVFGLYTCGEAIDGRTDLYWYQPAKRNSHFKTSFTLSEAFAMNRMSYWIYYKLLWNPYEDVDALIQKFCDKVYGEAADEMLEYYRLVELGWETGVEFTKTEFNAQVEWDRDQQYYYDYFFDLETDDGVYILDALKDALAKAYEAADDRAKEFIRYPYELFQDWTKVLK